MIKEKKIIVGVVNITTQPHSPKGYVKLFNLAHSLKTPIHVYGDQYALLAGCRPLMKGQESIGPIVGDIYKFTRIDPGADWFNIETFDIATEEDVDKVNIPEHLKPNTSRFSYVFYPKEHVLFYEGYYNGKKLTAGNAERFIRNLFDQSEIFEKFGKVDVTHIPEVNKLKEAFKMHSKERIHLVINRPNPDDHAEAEKSVLERMNARNVETYEQKHKVVPGKSILLDDELEVISVIASKNGSFYIKGKDKSARPVEYSTKAHPMVVVEYFQPEKTTAENAFISIVGKLRETMPEWLK